MKSKYTRLKKIGLILLIVGSLLTLVPLIIIVFKADIVLGIILIGLISTVAGGLILLKE